MAATLTAALSNAISITDLLITGFLHFSCFEYEAELSKSKNGVVALRLRSRRAAVNLESHQMLLYLPHLKPRGVESFFGTKESVTRCHPLITFNFSAQIWSRAF